MDFLRQLLKLTEDFSLKRNAKLQSYLLQMELKGDAEWNEDTGVSSTLEGYRGFTRSREEYMDDDKKDAISIPNMPNEDLSPLTSNPLNIDNKNSRKTTEGKHVDSTHGPSNIEPTTIVIDVSRSDSVHTPSAESPLFRNPGAEQHPFVSPVDMSRPRNAVAVSAPALVTVFVLMEMCIIAVLFTVIVLQCKRFMSKGNQGNGKQESGSGDKSDDRSSSGVSTSTPYSQRRIVYPGLGSALSDNTHYMIPVMSPIESLDRHKMCTFSATPAGSTDVHVKSKRGLPRSALSEERPRSTTWLSSDTKRALYAMSRSRSNPEQLSAHAATATSSEIETAIGKINLKAYKQEELAAKVISKWRQKSKKEETGKLSFAVSYDKELELLTVRVIKATHLPSVIKEGTDDIFVKISLEPDHKRRSMSSTIQHGSRNPDIKQNFAFRIARGAIHDMTVKFTVCEYDRFSHPFTIGQVSHALSNYDFEGTSSDNDTTERAITMDLQKIEKEEEGQEKGRMMVSLTYLPNAERVNLIVMKAQDLRLPEWGDREVGHSILDTFVKITIMRCGKVLKHKNTKVVRRSCSPVFNEAFSVDRMRLAEMSECCFVLSVCVRLNHFRSHRVIGRCVVGGQDCAVGNGLSHWNDMCDSPRSIVARWHKIQD